MKSLLFSIARFTLLAASAASALPAHAQSSPDDFESLIAARKLADLEALARARTSANPRDDIAWWFLARAVADDPTKREALLPRVETCTLDLPQSARCQHALATLYVAEIESAGMSAGLKYASRIKAGLARAVELEPRNCAMRRDLVQFYLQAPGIAGGSVRRANEQAEDFARLDPQRGRLLRVALQTYEKQWDQAEASLAGLTAPGDSALAEQITDAKVSLGFAMVNDQQVARARKVFETATALTPGSAAAHMGLGRALLEDKQMDAAIASLQRAVPLDGKSGAHYRLALAYEQKGDRQKAAAALEQFLSYRSTGPAVDDARKRLATMPVAARLGCAHSGEAAGCVRAVRGGIVLRRQVVAPPAWRQQGALLRTQPPRGFSMLCNLHRIRSNLVP
jgi:tetratricopeptide (TPR) repeat protein